MTPERATLVQSVLDLGLTGFSTELLETMARRGFLRLSDQREWMWDFNVIHGLSDATLAQLHHALTTKV